MQVIRRTLCGDKEQDSPHDGLPHLGMDVNERAFGRIDLQTVHATLVDVQQQISSTTQAHNQFLQALGLPLLPVE